jgi:hypothetical protein
MLSKLRLRVSEITSIVVGLVLLLQSFICVILLLTAAGSIQHAVMNFERTTDLIHKVIFTNHIKNPEQLMAHREVVNKVLFSVNQDEVDSLTIRNATKYFLENSHIIIADSTERKIELYLALLEAKGKGVLDSSTISFLFTFVTTIIVSIGVYLVNEVKKKQETLRKSVSDANSFIAAIKNMELVASQSLSIQSSATLCYVSSWELRKEISDVNLTTAEENFDSLKKVISKAQQDNICIEDSQNEGILDVITKACNNISMRISMNMDENIQDNIIERRLINLKKLCDQCRKLLTSGGFKERYNKTKSVISRDLILPS